MTNYTIWIDDQPYRGESEASEQAPPLSGGWYDSGPDSVSGITIGGGDPVRIEGRRNLVSHVDRIMRRIGYNGFSPEEITIRAINAPMEGFCIHCEHPLWGEGCCPNCRRSQKPECLCTVTRNPSRDSFAHRIPNPRCPIHPS